MFNITEPWKERIRKQEKRSKENKIDQATEKETQGGRKEEGKKEDKGKTNKLTKRIQMHEEI